MTLKRPNEGDNKIIKQNKGMYLVEHDCHIHELSFQMQLLETYALGTLGQNTSLQHHIISEWNPGNLVPPSTHKYDRHRHGNLQGYQLRATTVLVRHIK